ncbi:MAG: radical SAM protein [Actinobacteria bacterium]|nr:radical SAM protein [Actinomycetota bacterium]
MFDELEKEGEQMAAARRLPFEIAQYRWRYHWFRKKSITPTGPFYINVEPTSYCNIRCQLCSYNYSRKPGYMDVGLYEKIIDEAAALNIHEVAHFLAGEPLLHPELPYMIEYATISGMESRLHTNGMLLTEEKSHQLLDAGLAFLGVSFDGDDAETYNVMRKGSDFDQVIENIRTFLRLKGERGKTSPHVTLKVVKKEGQPGNGNGNAGDLMVGDEFRRRFAGLPLDRIKVIHPHSWRGEIRDEVPQVTTGDYYYPCMVLWGTMSIGWDGRVVGCAADLNGHDILGDLNRESIMDIWNGDILRHYREMHRNGRYQELDLCRDCNFVWRGKNPHVAFLMSKMPQPVKSAGKAVLSGTRLVGKDVRTRSFT